MSAQQNIPELLQKVSTAPEFAEIKEMEEFYFEKLKVLFADFQKLSLENVSALNSSIQAFYGNTLKFTPLSGPLPNWSDLIAGFKANKGGLKLYLLTLTPGSLPHFIFSFVGKLIAYFDRNGYNPDWNEYKPKRYVARSRVFQDGWVINLLKYKEAGNDPAAVSPSVRNAILYILEPGSNAAILSIAHRELVCAAFFNQPYHAATFYSSLRSLFQSAGIETRNPQNNGILYTRILYHPEVETIWNKPELEEQEEENTMPPAENDEPPPAEDNDPPPAEDNDPPPAEDENNQPNEPVNEKAAAQPAAKQQAVDQSTPVSRAESFSPSDQVSPTIGAKELSEELAQLLLKMGNDKGKMVGLFGQWGRGKTFLADHTMKHFENREHFIRVNFQAWKYQDTKAAWAYLYECFSDEYFKPKEGANKVSRFFSKRWKRFQLNRERNGDGPWIMFAVSAVLAAALFIVGLTGDDKSMTSYTSLPAWMADGLAIFAGYYNFFRNRSAEKANELIKRYFSNNGFDNLLGVQAEIQEELRMLLKCWMKTLQGKKQENEKAVPSKRILLFVDDIDRCPEERIISIIDALRVMLDDDDISKQVLVLAAIDERLLKRAIISKYYGMLKKDPALSVQADLSKTMLAITQEYMDKLFISGIRLGALTESDRELVLKSVINSDPANKNRKPRPVAAPPKEEEDIYNAPRVDEMQLHEIELPDGNFGGIGSGEEEEETPEPESEKDKPAATVQPAEGLTYGEEDALAIGTRRIQEATPRRLRIFYYRFLLAKNLLIAELNKGSDLTPENLAVFLAEFSSADAVITLSEKKTEMQRAANARVEVRSPGGLTHEMEKATAIRLFEVLETVIAY